MAEESYYTVTCACGKELRSHEKTFQCDQCGRLQEIVWPIDPEERPREEGR